MVFRPPPLSLVQATAAGGIGILAIMVSRVTRVPLSGRERIGALLSVIGLALLGVSLLGSHSEGSLSGYVWISVWLIASTIAVVVLIALSRVIGGGPAWGLAAGILSRRRRRLDEDGGERRRGIPTLQRQAAIHRQLSARCTEGQEDVENTHNLDSAAERNFV
jgi:hypothetical protein